MKLVLATHNRDKCREIKDLLSDLPVEITGAFDLPMVPHVEEDGETFQQNALKKARETVKKIGGWVLADDTGLCVAALKGAPGVLSARYAGPKASYEENVHKLLQEMKSVPTEKREAEFVCVMALVHADGREILVQSRLQGEITTEPKGKNGFGYDPVFWLPSQQKTMAELSLAEKNAISHRGEALRKIKKVLKTWVQLSVFFLVSTVAFAEQTQFVRIGADPSFEKVCEGQPWKGKRVLWGGVNDRRLDSPLGVLQKRGNTQVVLVSEKPLNYVFEKALQKMFDDCGSRFVGDEDVFDVAFSVEIERFYASTDKKLLTGKGSAESKVVIQLKKSDQTVSEVESEIRLEEKRIRQKNVKQLTRVIEELFRKTLDQIPQLKELQKVMEK